MCEFTKCASLDLADPLSRYEVVLAYRFKCLFMTVVEAESSSNDVPVAFCKLFQGTLKRLGELKLLYNTLRIEPLRGGEDGFEREVIVFRKWLIKRNWLLCYIEVCSQLRWVYSHFSAISFVSGRVLGDSRSRARWIL